MSKEKYSGAEENKTKELELWVVRISLCVVIICLLGIIIVMCQFYNSMVTLQNNYTSTLSQFGNAAAGEIAADDLKQLMSYMENLQTLQKNSMTNDLMSFIYGVLSSILVGLCAGFVVKCEQKADKANKKAEQARKDAKQAKVDAAQTKINASNALNSENEAKQHAENAKIILSEVQDILSRVREEATRAVSFAAKTAEEALKISNTPSRSNINNRLTKISLNIINAKMIFLSNDNKTMKNANDCCYVEIRKAVLALTRLAESAPRDFDIELVDQVRKNLKGLLDEIGKFRRTVKRQQEKGEISEGDYNSKNRTASNCEQWITDAIKACDSILKRIAQAA